MMDISWISIVYLKAGTIAIRWNCIVPIRLKGTMKAVLSTKTRIIFLSLLGIIPAYSMIAEEPESDQEKAKRIFELLRQQEEKDTRRFKKAADAYNQKIDSVDRAIEITKQVHEIMARIHDWMKQEARRQEAEERRRLRKKAKQERLAQEGQQNA